MAKEIIPYAEFRDIPFGGSVIQALRYEGKNYIAVPTLADANLVPTGYSAKQLQTRTDGAFQYQLVRKFRTSRNPKAINAIPLDDFRKVIRALDKKGVPAASALLDALLDVSIDVVIAAAFEETIAPQDILDKLDNYYQWGNSKPSMGIAIDMSSLDGLTGDDRAKALAKIQEAMPRAWGV